jgi:hypothetical protein
MLAFVGVQRGEDKSQHLSVKNSMGQLYLLRSRGGYCSSEVVCSDCGPGMNKYETPVVAAYWEAGGDASWGTSFCGGG